MFNFSLGFSSPLRVRAVNETDAICHVFLQLLKRLHMSDYGNFPNNERALIHSLASFNCFICRNLFQKGANNLSEMVNMVKSCKFCSNFTTNIY